MSVAQVQIVGLFVESLLYGMYLVTCAYCASALLRTGYPTRWRRRNELKWIIIAAALALFLNSPVNLAFQLYRVILAFEEASGGGEDLGNVSSWVNVGKTSTYVIQPCIGDAILIYRCFIVYNRSWKVISFSLLLWAGAVFCAGKGIDFQADLNTKGTVNSSEIRIYSMAFSSITVAQNIFTSSLLIWRFWRVESQNREFGSVNTLSHPTSRWMKIIRTIMETGLLITFSSTASLICRASSSNAIYPATCIEFMCVGIGFNLIIIRTNATYRYKEEPTIPLHVRTGTTASGTHSNFAVVMPGELGKMDDDEISPVTSKSINDKYELRGS